MKNKLLKDEKFLSIAAGINSTTIEELKKIYKEEKLQGRTKILP